MPILVLFKPICTINLNKFSRFLDRNKRMDSRNSRSTYRTELKKKSKNLNILKILIMHSI